jgi:hypothetical protein
VQIKSIALTLFSPNYLIIPNVYDSELPAFNRDDEFAFMKIKSFVSAVWFFTKEPYEKNNVDGKWK